MDKHPHSSVASADYETRDANARGVFYVLMFLGVLVVVCALLSWGLFRYLSRKQGGLGSVSPFADTRPLPLGPQLQVNPRQDYLKYREQQEQSLETYEWENRGAGIVRVPIERAMELLVQKGLPVQNADGLPAKSAPPAATPAQKEKAASQGAKKP